MDLGVRQIRTSGKGSGSIELTLPAGLRDLVGLPCRVILRDGSRPDIVLQPDLRHALAAFKTVWHAMGAAVVPDDAKTSIMPVALPLGEFAFGLQPRATGGEMPYLCWRDGLALAGPPPHDPNAVSRTLAAFGHAFAARLQIDPSLAAGFGAACGYMVTGVAATPDGQEACDIAARALRPDHHAQVGTTASDACSAGIMADAFWRHAGPLLAATAELFAAWTGDPPSHTSLRAAWWRGRSIEMSGD